MAVVAATVLFADGGAAAVPVPATLADRRPVQARSVEPGFPIDYLGVVWDTSGAGGSAVSAEVRFRRDDQWGPWTSLPADDLQSFGQ